MHPRTPRRTVGPIIYSSTRPILKPGGCGFQVNVDSVLPEVLDVHFRTPSVWPLLAGASTGTNVRRGRLNPNNFLKYELLLPSMGNQLRLRQIYIKVNDIKRLQTQTVAELDALLPAILDRAFKGELYKNG